MRSGRSELDSLMVFLFKRSWPVSLCLTYATGWTFSAPLDDMLGQVSVTYNSALIAADTAANEVDTILAVEPLTTGTQAFWTSHCVALWLQLHMPCLY